MPLLKLTQSPALLALLTLAATAWSEPVGDPFPEKIAKSDIRVELKSVATGLVSPVLLVAVPGHAERLVVVDQVGLLRVLENGALMPEALLDVGPRLVKLNRDYDERGLLGVAFDPDFAKPGAPGAGRVFTVTSEPPKEGADFPIVPAGTKLNSQTVLASWRMAAEGFRLDVESRKELMRIDKTQSNHNGGMIVFGPDGFLYLGIGDGGGANDLGPGHNPDTGNGQDKTVVHGKILRIDVNGTNSANGAYGIPQDNPFVKGGGVPEIYALGLRNPWRFGFDGAALIAADVGQSRVESVHRIAAGGNYGWRLKEGRFKFNPTGLLEMPDASLPAGLTDPVLQYDHDEGTSITGGSVYRGKALPALVGKYVFGDYRSPSRPDTGRLFFGDLASGAIREAVIGADDRELGFLLKGFGVDHEGEIYLCGSAIQGPSKEGGVVMKLVAP